MTITETINEYFDTDVIRFENEFHGLDIEPLEEYEEMLMISGFFEVGKD